VAEILVYYRASFADRVIAVPVWLASSWKHPHFPPVP